MSNEIFYIRYLENNYNRLNISTYCDNIEGILRCDGPYSKRVAEQLINTYLILNKTGESGWEHEPKEHYIIHSFYGNIELLDKNYKVIHNYTID